MGELFDELEALKLMKTLQASESFVIFGDYTLEKKIMTRLLSISERVNSIYPNV